MIGSRKEPANEAKTSLALPLAALPVDPIATTGLLAFYRSLSIYAQFSRLNRTIALVHPDVLALLYHFSAYGHGAVLELGAFVGGSTIAMSWGLRDAGRNAPLICVELGGALQHPTHGSEDIVRDLKRNLTNEAHNDCIRLIVGDSRASPTFAEVTSSLGGRKVGLIAIDSDGLVDRDWAVYRGSLSSGAYVVIDDYFSPGNVDKEKVTRAAVDQLQENGSLECLGLYGWGTWVGRAR
jgi:predicted O-methyltransferase YrrM